MTKSRSISTAAGLSTNQFATNTDNILQKIGDIVKLRHIPDTASAETSSHLSAPVARSKVNKVEAVAPVHLDTILVCSTTNCTTVYVASDVNIMGTNQRHAVISRANCCTIAIDMQD